MVTEKVELGIPPAVWDAKKPDLNRPSKLAQAGSAVGLRFHRNIYGTVRHPRRAGADLADLPNPAGSAVRIFHRGANIGRELVRAWRTMNSVSIFLW